MTTARGELYAALSKSLLDEIVGSSEPTAERAIDILGALEEESSCSENNDKKKQKTPAAITIEMLESTKIGKALTKTVKACRRHRRTSDEKERWDEAIGIAEGLLARFKEAADEETKRRSAASKKKDASTAASQTIMGLPDSASAYRTRLVGQGKDMHKDPPSLPPSHIAIEPQRSPKPKRDKATGQLKFACGEDDDDDGIEALLKDFRPNRTPEEVLRAGSFGGTYFRPITSAVTNVGYDSASVLNDTVDPKWIQGLDKSTLLTSSTYRPAVNRFGVKCGGSLGMWESSGWISDSDPYGWFQWYCRFYAGRRCSDDARQIGRWCKSAGPRGRFRSQLCNKIVAAGTTAGDARISPVIRQTLLHWGLEVTEDVLEKHRRR